jgi:hypothetical protein
VGFACLVSCKLDLSVCYFALFSVVLLFRRLSFCLRYSFYPVPNGCYFPVFVSVCGSGKEVGELQWDFRFDKWRILKK